MPFPLGFPLLTFKVRTSAQNGNFAAVARKGPRVWLTYKGTSRCDSRFIHNSHKANTCLKKNVFC